jgi:carboxypeptidase PM20D1
MAFFWTAARSVRRRRAMGLIAATALLLAGVMIGRAESFPSRQPHVAKLVGEPPVDVASAADHLAGLIQCRTTSGVDAVPPHDELLRAHAWLTASYPRLHRALTREQVGEGGQSLLYTWPAKAGSPPRRPILLLAHLDVVPVDGDPATWSHPPFDGVIADGFVWGRGAVDDKVSVVGILEAIESLLATGFEPDRTVYVALGHDEEISGPGGAQRIAALLESRGVHAAFALDEGGFVTRGMMPGIDDDVAVVGIAEKGYLTIDLSVDMPGGHSSAPSRETAVTVLMRALARLDQSALPPHLDDDHVPSLPFLIPEQSFGLKVVLANLWLTRPLVTRIMSARPASAATIRTTLAITGVTAGVKDNAVPTHASAMVNSRIMPGDTVAGIVESVRAMLDDPRVHLEPRASTAREPSPASAKSGPEFDLLARTIVEVNDRVLVTPYVTPGGTDGRQYSKVAEQIFRFSPVHATAEDLQRIHGKDERVGLDDLAGAIRFYRRLLQATAALP